MYSVILEFHAQAYIDLICFFRNVIYLFNIELFGPLYFSTVYISLRGV